MSASIQSMSDESLASLLGWISFACWILVYTPQIYENYERKSGEGVSIYLVVIWMLGDLANLVGAIKQHLLKTMIFLSIYYTACDLILLFQIYYYRLYPSKPTIIEAPTIPTESDSVEEGRVTSTLNGEQTPLLAPEPRTVNGDNAPKRWTYNYFVNKLKYVRTYCSSGVANYVGTYALILIIGVLGWSISRHTEHKTREVLPPTGEYEQEDGGETWNLTAQILGWISAFAYIGSRLPQILKNQVTKCHGLSLLFFLIGITGNITYFSSILIADRSVAHLLINLSWLVGSGGTIFLDFIVLYQFWIYRHERDTSTVLLVPDHLDSSSAP